MNKTIYISIALLVLVTLACGAAPAALPRADVSFSEGISPTAETSTDHSPGAVKMIVTVDKLHVRECPGMGCTVIDGRELKRGEMVTCTEFRAPMNGDGLWCRHAGGWSSAAYLKIETKNNVR